MRKKQEELLALVAEGNKEAFSELYDDLSPRVSGLIRRILKDPAQSEEVEQEVFLEIWQIAKQYSPEKGGAMSWIMTIAHRRAVDRVRASQASYNRDTKIGIRDYVPDYDDVSETVQIHLEHERVKVAMSRLTDTQRQAVTLAYHGGYTQKEIAEILNIPLGTVKTRLRDGMIRLRDELGVAA